MKEGGIDMANARAAKKAARAVEYHLQEPA